jgi:hypothetical protein
MKDANEMLEIQHKNDLGAPIGMFIFPIVLFILVIIFPIPFSFLVYFCMGYFWDLSLLSDKMRTKLENPNYRFSFVRMIYQFQQLIGRLPLLIKADWFSRVISPVLLACVYTILVREWIFIPTMLGACASELLFIGLREHEKSKKYYRH